MPSYTRNHIMGDGYITDAWWLSWSTTKTGNEIARQPPRCRIVCGHALRLPLQHAHDYRLSTAQCRQCLSPVLSSCDHIRPTTAEYRVQSVHRRGRWSLSPGRPERKYGSRHSNQMCATLWVLIGSTVIYSLSTRLYSVSTVVPQ